MMTQTSTIHMGNCQLIRIIVFRECSRFFKQYKDFQCAVTVPEQWDIARSGTFLQFVVELQAVDYYLHFYSNIWLIGLNE